MIKVLIVDDQLILKEGLRYILEHDNEICVVGFAEDGRGALGQCDKHLPDVVLMDIVMPHCDGVEGTRLIKEKYSQIKVIILNTSNDDENIARALKNGADGYMLKDSKPEELIMAVKAAKMEIRILHKSTLPNI
ncbi:MAG: response regulator [Bacillota bacterium]